MKDEDVEWIWLNVAEKEASNLFSMVRQHGIRHTLDAQIIDEVLDHTHSGVRTPAARD